MSKGVIEQQIEQQNQHQEQLLQLQKENNQLQKLLVDVANTINSSNES